MSTTELITRAKEFHKHAGFNPARYDYKLSSTFQGKTVKAYEIGTQVSYVVANYNSKSGRTITPLRSL
jgi:hypothetical protein